MGGFGGGYQSPEMEVTARRREAVRPAPIRLTDRSRVEFLFALYENLTAPLVPAAKAKRIRK